MNTAVLPRPVKLPTAALAAQPAPTLSHRYQFVDTRAVIEAVAQEGWVVHSARSAAPRSKDPLFAKHELDLRNPEAAPIVGGHVPRIIFINSHDGSSSARALAGVYRFVCSNGLIVGNTVDRVNIRHSGDAAADLIHRMRSLAANTQSLYEKIERWSKKDLTRAQRQEFARFASILRWGDPHRFDVEDLLQVRRAGDDRGDLWTTFNRVQENTVLGGIAGVSRSGRAATSRPLTDIDRGADYNAQLWNLAEEVAAFW